MHGARLIQLNQVSKAKDLLRSAIFDAKTANTWHVNHSFAIQRRVYRPPFPIGGSRNVLTPGLVQRTWPEQEIRCHFSRRSINGAVLSASGACQPYFWVKFLCVCRSRLLSPAPLSLLLFDAFAPRGHRRNYCNNFYYGPFGLRAVIVVISIYV